MSRHGAHSGPQSRWWMFTLNNPRCLPDFEDFPQIRYAIYSEEFSESGTNHLQGYVEFNRTQYLSFCKKILSKAHWEIRRGNQVQAIAYCSKVNDPTFIAGPYIYGTPSPGQGTRTDINQLKSDLDSGCDLRFTAQNHFSLFLRYNKGIEKYMSLLPEPQRETVYVYYFYGPTGSGKSHTAHLLYGGPDCLTKSPTDRWFDGYSSQKTIILDEYKSWLSYAMLLRLCDHYPLLLETKGSHMPARHKRVVITSTLLPDELHPEVRDKSEFTRRLHKFVYFASRRDGPVEFRTYSDFQNWRCSFLKDNNNDMTDSNHTIINSVSYLPLKINDTD